MFWAAWYTLDSSVKLDCRVPASAERAEARVTFLPLKGMDVRAQREF
jgi:hypothetical protein